MTRCIVSAELPDHCLSGTPPMSFARKGKIHLSLIADRPIPTEAPSTRNRRADTPNPRLQVISNCLLLFNLFTLPLLRCLQHSPDGVQHPIFLARVCFPRLPLSSTCPPLSWPLPSFIWPPSPSSILSAPSYASTHVPAQLGENRCHGETWATTGRRRR